jgi:hypothetical protein
VRAIKKGKRKRDTICENNRATTSQASRKRENLIIQLYVCVVCLLAYVREW